MNVPLNLKYTQNDEWINIDGKVATIGITDFAQSQLSDIVFVEVVLSVGEVASKGDTCATIESVKAAADVYCPVSGKILEVNDALSDHPEELNSDPFGQAWLLKIEISDFSEIATLFTPEAYKEKIQEKD
jgi:glycine cleavage system H protein